MKDNKFKEFMKEKGFYVALYSCAGLIVVLAGVISFMNYNSINSPKNENNSENQQAKIEIQSVEPVNQSQDKKIEQQTQNQTTTKANTDKKETTQSQTDKKAAQITTQATTQATETTTQNKRAAIDEDTQLSLFDEGKELAWPVSGEIVMDYSVETAIYDKTLDQYRTNDSLCISATVGSQVKAAADGIVEKIYDDEMHGKTIQLNHGNGWLATYSQLQENVLVEEGQAIAQGEVIGGVGEPTNYAVLLGPHLEFKITKDDEATDPKLLLATFE